MKNTIIIQKLTTAIESLTQEGELQFPGRWSADEGKLTPNDGSAFPMLAFKYPEDGANHAEYGGDVEKICRLAGVKVYAGMMLEGIEYIAVQEAQ